MVTTDKQQAAIRRVEARQAKVAAGLQDLDQWLQDMVRRGLAELPQQPYAYWDQAAARLVDAQAPGLAKRLQAMAGIPHTGTGWPARMLAALGKLYLLIQGYQRLDQLPEMMQAEVRSHIGFTQAKSALLEQANAEQANAGNSDILSANDTWHILGKTQTKEAPLWVQRIWLWGHQSHQSAMILNFAHGSPKGLDTVLVPGKSFTGRIALYPGTGLRRALPLATPLLTQSPRTGLGFSDIASALTHTAQQLSENPWQASTPLVFKGILLRVEGDRWWIQDHTGAQLPLDPEFDQGWQILALSGGQPLSLFGEWIGDRLRPLSVWGQNTFIPLARERTARSPTETVSTGQTEPAADHPLHWWTPYLTTALLGTDRQPPAPPAAPHILSDFLQQLDWTAPASAMLSAAGTVALYEQAGRLSEFAIAASAAQPVPLPSEPDNHPVCPTPVANKLKAALAHYPMALAELLEMMAASRQRVPPRYLPELLRVSQKRINLHPQIAAVIGSRGRWLAAQNPEWHYAQTLATETMPPSQVSSDVSTHVEIERFSNWWHTGDRRQRMMAIQQWRRVDPDGAREAIEQTWKGESKRDRERIISLFATHLSRADEPFLETVLRDRAKAIRQQAADFLVALPASALSKRMAERVAPLVQIVPAGPDSQWTIEVTLPETLPKDWVRDGIEKKPLSGVGERASWLQRLIGRVPLSYWPALPSELTAALNDHPWRSLLLDGWGEAICRQDVGKTNDETNRQLTAEWAKELLYDTEAHRWELPVIQAMLAQLSGAQREEYLRSHIPQTTQAAPIGIWLQLIAQSDQKWDFDFSRQILAQLMLFLQDQNTTQSLQSPPGRLALTLHPGLAPFAARALANLPQSQYPSTAWQRFLDEFLGLLNFRWEMYQAFVP